MTISRLSRWSIDYDNDTAREANSRLRKAAGWSRTQHRLHTGDQVRNGNRWRVAGIDQVTNRIAARARTESADADNVSGRPPR